MTTPLLPPHDCASVWIPAASCRVKAFGRLSAFAWGQRQRPWACSFSTGGSHTNSPKSKERFWKCLLILWPLPYRAPLATSRCNTIYPCAPCKCAASTSFSLAASTFVQTTPSKMPFCSACGAPRNIPKRPESFLFAMNRRAPGACTNFYPRAKCIPSKLIACRVDSFGTPIFRPKASCKPMRAAGKRACFPRAFSPNRAAVWPYR